jgi:hypothetical protein
VNDKLGGIWMEATMAYFKVLSYPGICLEKLRKRWNMSVIVANHYTTMFDETIYLYPPLSTRQTKHYCKINLGTYCFIY